MTQRFICIRLKPGEWTLITVSNSCPSEETVQLQHLPISPSVGSSPSTKAQTDPAHSCLRSVPLFYLHIVSGKRKHHSTWEGQSPAHSEQTPNRTSGISRAGATGQGPSCQPGWPRRSSYSIDTLAEGTCFLTTEVGLHICWVPTSYLLNFSLSVTPNFDSFGSLACRTFLCVTEK